MEQAKKMLPEPTYCENVYVSVGYGPHTGILPASRSDAKLDSAEQQSVIRPAGDYALYPSALRAGRRGDRVMGIGRQGAVL
jgi:hypothetical protein